MVSKKKSVKRQFAKSGKKLTKKYTKCVEYIKKQGAEVEEPEITEVLLTPEVVPEPEDEVVPEPEVVVPEPEDEVVEAENDFKFVEPSKFRVQGQLLNGDRVLEVDPLNVVDVPEPEETVEALEMINDNNDNNDKKVKAEKTTPKKKESATPKRRRGNRNKNRTSKRSRSSRSEKPKMKSLKSK